MTLRFSEICIDAHDVDALAAWWSRVLGWLAERAYDDDMVALPRPAPAGLFLPVPDDKVVKNRIHFDFTPTIRRPRSSGHRWGPVASTSVQGEQSWVVLADPEGNEFCILAAE